LRFSSLARSSSPGRFSISRASFPYRYVLMAYIRMPILVVYLDRSSRGPLSLRQDGAITALPRAVLLRYPIVAVAEHGWVPIPSIGDFDPTLYVPNIRYIHTASQACSFHISGHSSSGPLSLRQNGAISTPLRTASSRYPVRSNSRQEALL